MSVNVYLASDGHGNRVSLEIEATVPRGSYSFNNGPGMEDESFAARIEHHIKHLLAKAVVLPNYKINYSFGSKHVWVIFEPRNQRDPTAISYIQYTLMSIEDAVTSYALLLAESK